MISFEQFQSVDIRAGVVEKAESFPRARNPSYKVWVNFGEDLGIKKTSAQVTVHYTPDQLIGKKVLGAVNLATRNIAGFISEFLLLGLSDAKGAIHLATYDGDGLSGEKLH